MRYLRTNTATRVTVGPFLDKTDGITPEVALTVTNEKLTFMVDDGGVPTLVLDAAPTASGGNNDMVHVTNDDAGFYDLELAAANVNYLGRAMLALTDAANHCPVFHEFMILPAVIYDAMILGTDLFDVSVTQILGTAVSTPATAGILDVNVKNMNNVAATSITTINANQGTTQPINFTGTGASAYAKSDMVDIAGAAVSATTAQVGTNVVQLSGDATAADNAESFFDGTGYAGTNNVIPTVTTLNGIANNAITAAAIATGAIDADAIADNAIDAGAIATGAITNAKFAAGAIDAAAIATDAIGAAELAADAVAEIADQVWDEALSGHTGAGSAGLALAGASAPSAAAVADAVWDEASTGHTDAGKAGAQLWTSVDAILTDTGTTLDGKEDQIIAAVITNAAGTDIAADIIAIKADTAAILTDTGTTLDGKIDTIDGIVDSILTDTGTTLDGKEDQIIAAVITNAAGTDIAADIIAVKADTAAILTDTGTTLDGKIDTIDGIVDNILTDTGTTLPASIAALENASVEDIVAGVLAGVVQGTTTLAQAVSVIVSVCGGKSNGGGTDTHHYRDVADSKNVVTATLDEDGNRTAVTLSP